MFQKSFFLPLLVIASLARGEEAMSGPRVLKLTLDSAINMALKKNFSIAAERFGPKAARERERSARGRFDPAFGLSYSQGENVVNDQFLNNTTSGLATFDARLINQSEAWRTGVTGVTIWGLGYDLGVTAESNGGSSGRASERFASGLSFGLTQPLLRGSGPAANLAGVRVARNNVTISEWSVKQQVISVITQVIEVYNELHFSHENLEVARRSRELARQLLRDNIRRVEIGVKTPLDVTTAQAEVAAREEGVITAGRAVKDQENFLKQLIAADLIPLLGIRLNIAPPPSPDLVSNIVAGLKDALELRPDYRQARLDIENKNIMVAFAKNDNLPRLDLVASLRLLGFDDDFGSSVPGTASRNQRAWRVGATFSVPIGNRERSGRYNAAMLETAQALVRLQQLEQDIIVRVDNANGAVVTARERVAATEEARRLARESLNAGEARLVAGTGTTFEVLELQKKLTEAETAELRARADHNKAVARYRFQTGTTLLAHGVDIEHGAP